MNIAVHVIAFLALVLFVMLYARKRAQAQLLQNLLQSLMRPSIPARIILADPCHLIQRILQLLQVPFEIAAAPPSVVSSAVVSQDSQLLSASLDWIMGPGIGSHRRLHLQRIPLTALIRELARLPLKRAWWQTGDSSQNQQPTLHLWIITDQPAPLSSLVSSAYDPLSPTDTQKIAAALSSLLRVTVTVHHH